MKAETEIVRELLREGLEDFHGLWWLFGYYADMPNGAERKQRTLGLVQHLLTSGLFVAGFPASDGTAFHSWQLPPEAAVQRIAAEWETLGREPTLGDVAWFNLTPAGEAAARALVKTGA
jgi:hypothetical protein